MVDKSKGRLPDWAIALHPKTVDFLRRSDGSIRKPSYEEWVEDYGVGYLDKKNWEQSSLTPDKFNGYYW